MTYVNRAPVLVNAGGHRGQFWVDLIAVVEAQAGFHHLTLVYKDNVIQICLTLVGIKLRAFAFDFYEIKQIERLLIGGLDSYWLSNHVVYFALKRNNTPHSRQIISFLLI